MHTRCSTGDADGAAGLLFSLDRVFAEASMMSAFYHGERAIRRNATGSILKHQQGIS
jgi:hypothetical protein